MYRLILIVLFSITTQISFAQSAREIMQSVLNRDDGDNITQNTQMQLFDKNGSKRVKNMKTFSKDVGKDTKKLTFFLSPSDIKNTSFLTYDYDDYDKDDDQWMYLPALKKVKRIPSSDKDSSFMGSDFTYSDMTKPNLSDYKYKILKSSTIKRKSGKVPVWQIEVLPKDESIIDETGYTKSIVYIRKDNRMVVRAKHYLKKANKIKYMDVKKIKKISGISFATVTTMTTKKSGKTIHKTVLLISNISMVKSLKEGMFTTRKMTKGI
jgi:hypothetical protein